MTDDDDALRTEHVHCASCPHYWCPKMLIEKLSAQQVHIPQGTEMLEARTRDAFGYLLAILHEHRPVGSDGKHGATGGHPNLCTPTCGCETDD